MNILLKSMLQCYQQYIYNSESSEQNRAGVV